MKKRKRSLFRNNLWTHVCITGVQGREVLQPPSLILEGERKRDRERVRDIELEARRVGARERNWSEQG